MNAIALDGPLSCGVNIHSSLLTRHHMLCLGVDRSR